MQCVERGRLTQKGVEQRGGRQRATRPKHEVSVAQARAGVVEAGALKGLQHRLRDRLVLPMSLQTEWRVRLNLEALLPTI